MTVRCQTCLIIHAPRCPSSRDLRWPAAPLYEALGGSHSAVCAALHVSWADVARADLEGLTDVQADHWCAVAGLHPSMIYGEAWDQAALLAADDVFINGPGAGWRQAWLCEMASS